MDDLGNFILWIALYLSCSLIGLAGLALLRLAKHVDRQVGGSAVSRQLRRQ